MEEQFKITKTLGEALNDFYKACSDLQDRSWHRISENYYNKKLQMILVWNKLKVFNFELELSDDKKQVRRIERIENIPKLSGKILSQRVKIKE